MTEQATAKRPFVLRCSICPLFPGIASHFIFPLQNPQGVE
jgi:hypothetical protein